MWLESFGGIDNIVFYVFCAIAGAIALLAVVNLVVGLCKPNTSPSLSIDFNVIAGGLLLATTVLLRGIDPEWSKDNHHRSLSTICDLYKAVLLIGLTQFVGGLFVKVWCVYLYNTFNKDKKPLSEEWKPNLWIWLLLVIIGIIIIVWAVRYDTHLIPYYVVDGTDLIVECKGEKTFEWTTATSVWHAFLLFLAVIAVPINCYTKPTLHSNLLSAVIFNTLFSTVAGVVAHFVYEGTRTAEYAISGGLILWAVIFSSVFLLISKLEEPRHVHRKKICDPRATSEENQNYGQHYDTISSDKRMSQRSDRMMDEPEGCYD